MTIPVIVPLEFNLEEVDPVEIFDEVLDDQALYTSATDSFVSSFSCFGNTLAGHSEYLHIDRPRNMTPDAFRQIQWELIEKLQFASDCYSIALSIYNAVTNGAAKKQSQLMAEISSAYEKARRKKPAATIIQNTAETYLKDTKSIATIAKIIKDYWKTKYDELLEVRRCVEQIGISMHSEMKHLQNS